MPVYEYVCENCGDHFDIEQRITDDALTTHEKCGGKLSKVFSSAGIVLKGSGFYKTDSRKSTSIKPSDSGSTAPSSQKEAGSKPQPSDKSASKPSDRTSDKSSKK